jgi:hypothetical protein
VVTRAVACLPGLMGSCFGHLYKPEVPYPKLILVSKLVTASSPSTHPRRDGFHVDESLCGLNLQPAPKEEKPISPSACLSVRCSESQQQSDRKKQVRPSLQWLFRDENILSSFPASAQSRVGRVALGGEACHCHLHFRFGYGLESVLPISMQLEVSGYFLSTGAPHFPVVLSLVLLLGPGELSSKPSGRKRGRA